MTFTFNLWSEPWIPCVDRAGEIQPRSIRQTLADAPALIDVHCPTPPQTVATYRLLLALLHRVLGPSSRAAWSRLYQAGAFDVAALDAYMQTWQGRFDLFDEAHPFYQSDGPGLQPKSIINLALEMTSGNNAVLFDHHLESDGARFTAAEAALALISSQAFGVGGLSGLPEKFTDAPLAKGVVFLAQGATLFETLLFNLVVVTADKPLKAVSDDQPVWERESLCLPQRTTVRGYLDYLTWPNRKIRLRPERAPSGELVVRTMTWAPGLRLAMDDPGPFRHATPNDQKGTEPWRVLQFRSNRALWRDSLTLFTLSQSDAIHTPAAFRHLATLAAEGLIANDRVIRFMALGMAKDQAKIEYFRHERSPLPIRYLETSGALLAALGDEIKRAERVGLDVWRAVQRLGRALIVPRDDDERISREQSDSIRAFVEPWGAETRYWAALDLAFPDLWLDLPDAPDRARQQWRDAIRDAARASLRAATIAAGYRRHAWHGVVEAERLLTGALRDALDDARPVNLDAQGGSL